MELFKFFTKKEKSKNVAKERLKMVLVQDRAELSPNLLEKIKSDLIKVISEYAEVDEEGFDIKMTRMKKEDNSTISALVANIPITNTKNV